MWQGLPSLDSARDLLRRDPELVEGLRDSAVLAATAGGRGLPSGVTRHIQTRPSAKRPPPLRSQLGTGRLPGLRPPPAIRTQVLTVLAFFIDGGLDDGADLRHTYDGS